MDPCEDKSLLAFNDFVTHPCDLADLLLSLREGEGERKVPFCFLVVPCKSAFSGNLGKSFLATLDAVASSVHLKVTYHNDDGKPIVFNTT